jgi:predicted flap endonuclease-1-like 5' DNA nuclease
VPEEVPEEAALPAEAAAPAAEEAVPVAAAAAVAGSGNGSGHADDLTQLVGIGPRAASALAAAGITSYAALAEANEPALRHALHAADMVPPGNVATWPMQATYAVKGDWQGLMKHNEKATASRPRAAAAAGAAGGAAVATKVDDLTQISGIGPRISSILNDGGITSYAQLEHANTGELRQIIAVGGTLPPSSLDTLADPGLLRGAGRLVGPRDLQPAPLNLRAPRARARAGRARAPARPSARPGGPLAGARIYVTTSAAGCSAGWVSAPPSTSRHAPQPMIPPAIGPTR